jgi:hypothetical protein
MTYFLELFEIKDFIKLKKLKTGCPIRTARLLSFLIKSIDFSPTLSFGRSFPALHSRSISPEHDQ